ncbi:MAG: DEAD/DEAH box helicase [Gallionella sp.]|nr:DEAD/DEAH box helicase [Gallionella sp.]MDD4945996.1 DEAD/DEAH box helicase [Gallionella sp.]
MQRSGFPASFSQGGNTLNNISFTDLNLAPEIFRALTEAGYATPTPIQAQAIPLVMQGSDLMAGAQTGTGKTAAFALPVLQKLMPFASASTSPARHPVRALVLVPTRELAIQVEESVKAYAKYSHLRSLVVFGGVDIKTQTPHLRNGVEILVATPGRLLDHIEQKTVQLGQVQMLVLDEADRMLDMGFMPDLKRILALLPKQRQNLMFSATFSAEIKKLSEEFLVAPKLIEVARSNATNENITQKVYLVEQDDKHALLAQLLRDSNSTQTLVFTKRKLTAGQLASRLHREGIAADAIHGDKTQQERIKALEAFKDGSISVLIGTDVAARGLDIDQLPVVINYEMPSAPEDYVHRIGRTGRAGALGMAISLVAPEEEKYLTEIEKLINRKIQREALPEIRRAPRTPHPAHSVARPAPAAREWHAGAAKKHGHDAWYNKPYEPAVNNQPKVESSSPVAPLSARPAAQIPALFVRRKPILPESQD